MATLCTLKGGSEVYLVMLLISAEKVAHETPILRGLLKSLKMLGFILFPKNRG